jgi:hypothetical protein
MENGQSMAPMAPKPEVMWKINEDHICACPETREILIMETVDV